MEPKALLTTEVNNGLMRCSHLNDSRRILKLASKVFVEGVIGVEQIVGDEDASAKHHRV
jgi:hypothetical protein